MPRRKLTVGLVQMRMSESVDENLERASRKIGETAERGAQAVPMHDAQPATAHMFIVNPLSGGSIMKLFSTHPPVAERVKRLRELGGRGAR